MKLNAKKFGKIFAEPNRTGDKSNIENHRLISLTSLVMKVMERYVRDEIYSKCWHLINKKQHGFLPQKSCTTQLVTVLDDMSLNELTK